MEEKNKLKELKEKYSKLGKKYGLPKFEELNQDFQIEKATESETDYLLREIRKFIADKFSNYLRFVETLLNPVNVPMFVFYFVKSVNSETKNKLSEIHKKLAKAELTLIELDTKFSEDNEAEFIKESYKMWQGIKKEILDITGSLKKNWENNVKPNDKGYFG